MLSSVSYSLSFESVTFIPVTSYTYFIFFVIYFLFAIYYHKTFDKYYRCVIISLFRMYYYDYNDIDSIQLQELPNNKRIKAFHNRSIVICIKLYVYIVYYIL